MTADPERAGAGDGREGGRVSASDWSHALKGAAWLLASQLLLIGWVVWARWLA